MDQSIDKSKLKASAEHLEWTLNQYPENTDAQSLLKSLLPFIEQAKAEEIHEPIDRQDLPGTRGLGEGIFIPCKNPSIDDAYVSFSIELRGGLNDKEKIIIKQLEKMRKGIKP
ncbi:MAG: hypothetical protein M3Y65_02735 [Pseudomonadota bacterium]|nr:hypothetical protein [Pseudomonadota bacterium]